MFDFDLTQAFVLLNLTLGVCVTAFLLGGLVKGTLGVGLPLFAVPMMSLVIPSTRAIGLVAVPVVFSNLWQMVDSRKMTSGWKRFWPLISTQLIATILTVKFTLSLNESQMSKMVAFSMMLALVLMIYKPSFKVSAKREKKMSALAGALSGLLGGVSALTGPVIITYLMALKLSREEFVGCISIIYLSSALPLYGAMLYYARTDVLDLGYSALALIPMALGLMLGKQIRQRISEKAFRWILYAYLTMMSIVLLIRS
jgi:uncharacterized membrane protein YfcA